jgi:ornithine carbamoyltransferase
VRDFTSSVGAAAEDRRGSSMSVNLKGRHFLKLLDFEPAEIRYLLDFSARLKAAKKAGDGDRRLTGKSVALLFEKPSTRTRAAFTVACVDEGAHPEYLGKSDIQLGKKETVADTARVLGRMFDGIQYRGFAHELAEQLAEHSGVPVWNGLTDAWHPTQILADLLTVQEEFGTLENVVVAYAGDGRNNVARSLLVGCAKLGVEVRIVAPVALHPEPELVATVRDIAASTGAEVAVTASVDDGVRGAHAIYTDVWASMGEEDRIRERIDLLAPYKVTRRMMDLTGRSDTVFLHCLPAFHNLETELAREHPDIREVEDEVFEGPQSRVFEEAENRLHTIKAVMVATMVGEDAG